MKKKTIKLKNGNVLLVSESFAIAEETFTSKENFAGVIADKYEEVPHLIFFSEKPVNEFGCEEEDALLDKLIANRPEFLEIRKNEISLKCVGKDGVSLEDWAAKMRLGMFAVPEVEDEKHLFHGVGIIKKKEACDYAGR